MPSDLEQRLRQSLGTRAHDVEADPAAWQRVRGRIRRRAAARWSVGLAAAAAAIVVAALVLPGLLGTTRVDFSPADPGGVGGADPGGGGGADPGGGGGALHIATTDGRMIAVTNLAGDVVSEFDASPELVGLPPITRVAVRPGSTPDNLTVAYLHADAACTQAVMRWLRVRGDQMTSGHLEHGYRGCLTDPVWAPGGDVVAWIEQDPADRTFAIHFRGWDTSAGGPAAQNTRLPLESVISAEILHQTETLRLSDWLRPDVSESPITLLMSAVESGPRAQMGIVQLSRQSGFRFARALPSSWGAEEPRPIAQRAADRYPQSDVASYVLGFPSRDSSEVHVWRNDRGPFLPLRGLLPSDQVERGDAWLSARGSTVVFGSGGHAWSVRWQGDGWAGIAPLPGVVHADVIASPAAEPKPTPLPPPPFSPG